MRDSWERSRTTKEFRRWNLLRFLAGCSKDVVDSCFGDDGAKDTLDTEFVMSLVFRSSSEALVTLSRLTSHLSRLVSFNSRSRLFVLRSERSRQFMLSSEKSVMLLPMVGSFSSEGGKGWKNVDLDFAKEAWERLSADGSSRFILRIGVGTGLE